MTTPAHIKFTPADLAHIPDAVLVGECNGRIRITGAVAESKSVAGMLFIESEVGTPCLPSSSGEEG